MLPIVFAVMACTAPGTRQAKSLTQPPVTPLPAVAQSCAIDFDTLHFVVTHDYAGYQDRMRERGPRITAVGDSVRAVIRTVSTDSACTATIARWTALFREHDNHFQFWQPRPDTTSRLANTGSPAADAARPTIRFVDDSSALITIPSLGGRYKPAIDSLIETHRARLLSTPYLVVDLRRNPGGATSAYRRVMELVYTNPIPREGFDMWVSEGTIAAARPYLTNPSADSGSKADLLKAIERYESTRQPFFFEGQGDALRYDSVYAMPRAVAVLTGRGCASSCEQFVLDAMHSRKVTVFGTGNTGGLLDYGNIAFRNLPSGKRRLGTATTRSRRLPARPLDKTGIAPHVVIAKDEPDPVAFALAYLRRGGRTP